MAPLPDRRQILSGAAVIGAILATGPDIGTTTSAPAPFPRKPPGSCRIPQGPGRQLVIGREIVPVSDFDELPDEVLHAMIAAIYGLEDAPDLVDFAFAWTAPPIKAALAAGTRHGYHFFRCRDGSRPLPEIHDDMIDAFEPNICWEESSPVAVAGFHTFVRHALRRALTVAEAHGYYYYRAKRPVAAA